MLRAEDAGWPRKSSGNTLAANGANTVEDLEAIWASAPAPEGGKVLAAA
jgi:hypothetical protein